MKFAFDHDYHIHSYLSECSSDPKQTPNMMLEYAEKNGLSKLCITDHYWDRSVPCLNPWYVPQDFEHISAIRPLPSRDGIRFFFGCETDMDFNMTLGIPRERFDDFDFIIIPTTHLDMTEFTVPKGASYEPEYRAVVWAERLSALLNMDLPFHKIGIAHLACSLINTRSREDYLRTLELIPTDTMQALFAKAANLSCGIELNQGDMSFTDAEADTVLRMFRVAKAQGCKFYIGSDAHHPNKFNSSKAIFERAIDFLGLTEEDKFKLHPCK